MVTAAGQQTDQDRSLIVRQPSKSKLVDSRFSLNHKPNVSSIRFAINESTAMDWLHVHKVLPVMMKGSPRN